MQMSGSMIFQHSLNNSLSVNISTQTHIHTHFNFVSLVNFVSLSMLVLKPVELVKETTQLIICKNA